MNNEGFNFFDPTNSSSYSVLSDGKVSVTNNFPKYANTSGLLLTDSGVPVTSFNDYLKKDGSVPMTASWNTGNFDMKIGNIFDDTDDTFDIGQPSAKRRRIYAHDIQTPLITQPSTDDNIVIGNNIVNTGQNDSANIVIGDSASAVDGSIYNVAIGFQATINGNQAIAIGSQCSTVGNGISIGNQAGGVGTENVAIGKFAAGTGDGSVAIGSESDAYALQGVAIGTRAFAGSTQYSVALGTEAKASGNQGIVLGALSTSSGIDSIMIGTFGTNSVDSSCKIGGTDIINIRPSSAICDLGTTAEPFQDLNVSRALLTTNNKVIVGKGNNAVNVDSVVVGNDNVTSGTGFNKSIIVGSQNNSSSTNGQSIMFGNNNSDANTVGGSFVYGFGNTNGDGSRNVLIGRDLTVSNSVDDAISIGWNTTNSVSGTALIGSTNLTDIRPASTACDLGFGAPFRNLYLSGKGYVSTSRPIMSGGYTMITNTQVGPSSTANTDIIGAGVGTLTSIANSSIAGNCSRMEAGGSITIGAGPQTITLRFYAGPTSSTLLATFPLALSTVTGSPPPWRLVSILTVKTIGATGTIQINSTFTVNDTSPTTFVNQTLATFNSTNANIIRVTAQWTSSNASNVFITNQFMTHSIYSV